MKTLWSQLHEAIATALIYIWVLACCFTPRSLRRWVKETSRRLELVFNTK